ncbi:hypothetical protein AB0M29_28005 [Streptomyces sp. NPDC051976]|uniref:hypothetical protein n=1 Tax=Streptomyces sp. NPDC051976 TaxID=3154947 RepID=UPI0034342039
MGEFTGVVLGFPTVLFSGALVVVVGFWGLVLVGGADAHGPGHHGAGGHHGPAHHGPASHGPGRDHEAQRETGLLASAGLDGVPVTVVCSLLIAFAWFLSLAGSAALDGAGVHGVPRALLDCAVLIGALVGSWSVTWVLVHPLRRLFPHERAPSREDFVGLLCTIRTGRVTSGFGQAEVTADDGSTAVVQVRQSGADTFPAGSTGLLYAFEPDGEFFWVAPFDPSVT